MPLPTAEHYARKFSVSAGFMREDDVRVEKLTGALRAVFYRLQVSQSSCAVGASLPASLRSLRFLTTQPQLTAFARALCVCRVESCIESGAPAACAAALALATTMTF